MYSLSIYADGVGAAQIHDVGPGFRNDQHSMMATYEAASQAEIVVLAATDQETPACDYPSLQYCAIKHHDQASARRRYDRTRSSQPDGWIAHYAEGWLDNTDDSSIKVKTLACKLLESGHAGRIKNPAQRLGTCQDKSGGVYRRYSHSREKLQKLKHTRPAPLGVLDQEYGATSACSLMPQKDHEQIMEIIKFDRLKLKAQLCQRARQEILDTVARRINPYQIEIITALAFVGKMVEESAECRLRAAGKYREWTLTAQAPVQISRGRCQCSSSRRQFGTGSLQFTWVDQCGQWLESPFLVWDQSSLAISVM